MLKQHTQHQWLQKASPRDWHNVASSVTHMVTHLLPQLKVLLLLSVLRDGPTLHSSRGDLSLRRRKTASQTATLLLTCKTAPD